MTKAEYSPPVMKGRQDQMQFSLTRPEVDRLRRFGEVHRFAAGDYLFRTGDTGVGMAVILSGRVEVSRRDGLGNDAGVTTVLKNGFIAEAGQLSGGGSFVDARAQSAVEALMMLPAELRALVIAEAELGERIMRALILRRVGLIESGAGGPVLVGPAEHFDLIRLQTYLARNGIPYRALDPNTELDADTLAASGRAVSAGSPIVLLPDGTLLDNPSERELAERLGLLPRLDPARRYDVAVVGAGPAGLATAVYAASEGLSVLVLDGRAFGGQAGASARIENYLGFPTGISGQSLTGRAFVQAQKFGADVLIPVTVERLSDAGEGGFGLELTDGATVQARSVVIATGADYRRPHVTGLSAAERDGVHYWASAAERNLCAGQDVALVGGGNSAGQAAVFLASRARKVFMLIRGPGLEATMSRYLIDRLAALPNVELLTHTEIEGVEVDDAGALCRVIYRKGATAARSEHPLRHLFLFIGAEPCTRWLDGCGVAMDARGYVATGEAARPLEHGPPALMTNLDGVFAVGDVRSGSTKRVAAAVGEGAAVAAQIHAYLATTSMASAEI